MSTSQVSFYTNRVGIKEMRRDGQNDKIQTNPGSEKLIMTTVPVLYGNAKMPFIKYPRVG